MKLSAPNGTKDRARPIRKAELPPHTWSQRIRFRHGQCDPAGIVYTPNFLDVSNQAVEQWFDEVLKIDYYKIILGEKIGLGYVNVDSTFFIPCLAGDYIDIYIQVERVGKSSYTLTAHGIKGEQEAFRIVFTTVITDLNLHKPAPIPDDIKEALLAYGKK